MNRRSASLVMVLSLGGAAHAEAPAKPKPCAAPEYRQFDFWAGDWRVTTPDGQHAGDNRVEVILGGCALQENWTGSLGGKGHSYNAWDAGRKLWHQTWVDAQGTVLLLDGGLKGGSMVLSGKSGDATHRISWTPQKDGSVRQRWESSRDDGKTWTVIFDGQYRKK